MPELPEIEHLATSLRPLLVGKQIVDWRCRQPKMLNLPPAELAARARGAIVAVERRGKSCVLRLAAGSIWLHLGLGGVVALGDAAAAEQAQLALLFADGSALTVDRTFMGHAHYLSEEEHARRWAELGAEPMADDFTLAHLQALLRRKPKQPLKALLMEQSLIAGIGNVYSDELLHAARLHPRRAAGSLNDEEAARLYAALRRVLAEATAAGGEPDYVDLHGRQGRYELRVHGKPLCRDCGSATSRLTLGGRSAYFCPRCQA